VTSFEIAYLCFGSFVCLAGLTMIATYSATNPWWRTHIGRMLVTYAAAEIMMSFILLLAVVVHIGPHWFRGVWFVLQAIVGGCFVFQTIVILRLHKAARNARELDH